MIGAGKAILSLFVAGLLAGPALAQATSTLPLSETGDTLVLEAMGYQLSLPQPDWLSDAQRGSGAVTTEIETHFNSDERQALLEIYPKGETQALWRTLYGARITLNPERPLSAYRRAVMAGYARTCTPELTGFFQLGQDEGENLAPLGFVCGAYLDRLAAFAGEGEVMVMSFKKSDAGVAIVYQEWRGKAFDPSRPDTWPVSPAVVQARAEQLHAGASLVPAN